MKDCEYCHVPAPALYTVHGRLGMMDVCAFCSVTDVYRRNDEITHNRAIITALNLIVAEMRELKQLLKQP